MKIQYITIPRVDFYPVIITEAEIKQRPNDEDIAETKQIFKDMGITANIPKFQDMKELLKWRKNTIDNFLDSVTDDYKEQNKPPKKSVTVKAELFIEYYNRYLKHEFTQREMAAMLNVTSRTIAKYIAEIKKQDCNAKTDFRKNKPIRAR